MLNSNPRSGFQFQKWPRAYRAKTSREVLRLFSLLPNFNKISLISCFLQITCYSQESGGPPKKEQSLKSKRKLRKADKKKWKEERSAQRAEEKNRDTHHKRVQTKAVYKRMKQSRAKSNAIRYPDHRDALPCVLRIFINIYNEILSR